MTRARTLADMISDGVIGTTELADDAITPVKLDETGSYAMAGLTVDTNTLHVDSANNRVGIGTTSPASQAHIYNAAASANLRIETDADAYASISFLNDQSNWGAGVDTANHFYVYDSINSSNVMEFGNNDIVFNQTGKDYDFRVESDSRSNALVLDGGTGGLALNTTNSDFYTGFDTTSIKLGPVASMWSLSNGSSDRRMTIDQNLYVNTDGTNRYLTTGAAARYQMNTGTHRFETAPSGSDDAAATSTVQMLIENDGEVRMLPSNTDAQNLKFRTTSTAGRSVIKSITREDSGSVNPMSQLQLMAYGTNSYLGQFKVVLNSSDTYNSTNQNNVADFKGTGGLVLNESGLSYLDFRVESDNQSHMLFLDASANSIGIRNSSPSSAYIIDAIGDTRFDGNVRLRTSDQLQFADTNDLNIYSDGTTNALLRLNNGRNLRIDATGAAGISQLLNPSTGVNVYYGNNQEAMRLTTETSFNDASVDRDFRVESNNNAHMLFVNAGTDRFGIGESSPDTLIHATSSTARVTLESTADDEASIAFITPTGPVYMGEAGANGELISTSAAGDFVISNRTGGDIHLSADTSFSQAHLTIDELGRITMPYQPAFMAKKTSVQEQAVTTNTKITFGDTDVNVGSHYSTANSRFTAPVGGTYYFAINLRLGAEAYVRVFTVQVKKNGSTAYARVFGTGGTNDFDGGAGNDHPYCSGSIILTLAANDYIEMFTGSEIQYTDTLNIQQGNGVSQFMGYLIG